MENKPGIRNRIEAALANSRWAQLGEIVSVFLVAFVVITACKPIVADNVIAMQGVTWVANILMLLIVWFGLRLRGQGIDHFGLSFQRPSFPAVRRTLLRSVVVFMLATAAFLIGAIVMANIVGIPEGPDLDTYNYLSGNLPMLIIALLAVYIASSFGEEVIYRAFLINRISEIGLGGIASPKIAVILSAIIFGLAHYDWGISGFVQTTFMGLILGFAYLRMKRNLWVLILAHAYMDTILMVQMYFADAR
ncbi:MAG: CPBP family intramembrane metalloprotease [Fidelibacterota bacterium]|nr:MAG: CPBP family intramembrane metalloprotease [Candidatus Neomarinimicrobiota bacterium]